MPHQTHFVLGGDRQVPEGLVLYLHHHAAALVLKKVTVLAGDLFQDMAFQNTGGIIPGIEHVGRTGQRRRDTGAHETRRTGTRREQKQAGGQQKQHRKNSHHDSAGGPPAGSARPACQTT